MSDSVILKRLPPQPRPSSKLLRQRRKQRNMILGLVAAILLGVAGWGLWAWRGNTRQAAAKHIEAGIKLLTPATYPQAIEAFNQALELDPNSFDGYYQRAQAYKNLNDLTSAARDLETALQLKPDSAEALSSLAAAHRQAGERERAIDEFTRAIALLATPDAYFQRGSTYQEMGQHEKAIADFTWVIDAIRDTPFVYFARANSKRALGDEEGARQDEATAHTYDRTGTLR